MEMEKIWRKLVFFLIVLVFRGVSLWALLASPIFDDGFHLCIWGGRY
jgi:hypothetical protein